MAEMPEEFAELLRFLAILLETSLKLKQKEIDDAQVLVDTLKAELEGLSGQLFMRLKEVYPTVTGSDERRIVKHKGVLYYVGLDVSEEKPEG